MRARAATQTPRYATAHRKAQRTAYRTARAVSLLEVVFATVILSMTVATIASAVHGMLLQQQRSSHRLATAELASRLIIQYLDDPKSLPGRNSTLDYDESEYRWRISVTKVASELDPRVESAIEEQQTRSSPSTPESRLRKVAVTVWLAERSGGSIQSGAGAPETTVVRLIDPQAIWRRPPNAIENMINRPGGQEELIRQILGVDEVEEGSQ